MLHRSMLLRITLSGATLLIVGACSRGESRETLGAIASAIYGGSFDADSAAGNSVVRVGGCSGILITPRIALTAGHCVSGSEGEAGSGDPTPAVNVGALAGANLLAMSRLSPRTSLRFE